MKCIDCKTKNINDANYCIKCCHKFTEEEQKKAKKKTIVGIIESIENAYSICTLKVITDHILYKILSILLLLGLGLNIVINNGNSIRIEHNDAYEISYNELKKEYYLKVKEEETNIELYVPNKVKKLTLKHWNKDNKLIEEKEYNDNNSVKASPNKEDDYYTIEAFYNENATEEIVVYLYQ